MTAPVDAAKFLNESEDVLFFYVHSAPLENFPRQTMLMYDSPYRGFRDVHEELGFEDCLGFVDVC